MAHWDPVYIRLLGAANFVFYALGEVSESPESLLVARFQSFDSHEV